MLDAGHFNRMLQEVLILFLDINGHRMIMVNLKALMRRGVLVLHFLMMIGALVMFRLMVMMMIVLMNYAGPCNGHEQSAQHLRLVEEEKTFLNIVNGQNFTTEMHARAQQRSRKCARTINQFSAHTYN